MQISLKSLLTSQNQISVDWQRNHTIADSTTQKAKINPTYVNKTDNRNGQTTGERECKGMTIDKEIHINITFKRVVGKYGYSTDLCLGGQLPPRTPTISASDTHKGRW